jgi:hypothetical protein
LEENSVHFYRIIQTVTASAATLAFVIGVAAVADAQVAITINGNDVDVSPTPIIQAGRVFVPLRGVFENLGASVVYSDGQINATGNGRDIALHIGSTDATVDGQGQTIDVAPFIVGESTFVPLRFVSQALGASVSWDQNNRVVAIAMAGQSQTYPAVPAQQTYSQGDDWVMNPPPPIPYYQPPPVPQPNVVWMPGYWAWGIAGYFWVPGTWVEPPQVGYLWTPGYWGWRGAAFSWHQGYWGSSVGFYGGVNYGGGYYGHDYVGARWSGNHLQYNTAVVNVTNTTIIKNVYVNRTVIVNNTTINRISYNGGPHGIAAQPTPVELAAARAPHVAMTSVQVQHVHIAAQDRRLLASVNAGRPPVVAAARPFTPESKPAGAVPVTPHDRVAAQRSVTIPVPAPAMHAAAPAPAMHAAAPAPAMHAAAPVPAHVAPEASHPVAARPVEPLAAHAATVHPEDVARPEAAQPEAAHPAAEAPEAAHPVTAYPAPAKPAEHTAEPVAMHPVVKPQLTQPVHVAPEYEHPAEHAPAAAPAYHAPAAAPAYHAPVAAPAYHAPAAAPAYHAPAPKAATAKPQPEKPQHEDAPH